MKIEITFSSAESELLEQSFRANADYLAQHWHVTDMGSYVKLLAMHGVDNLADLVSTQSSSGV